VVRSRARAGAAPAEPVRVLMGIPAPGATAGGPALHLPMLVEDLRAAGHAVVTMPYGRWAERESMVRKAWHQWLDLLRYPALLHRTRPDVVHLNSSFDPKAIARDAPFALLTRLAGKPLFIKWHGSEPEYLRSSSLVWKPLVRMLLANTRAIGVLSSEEQAAVRRCARAPACHVVRNGLDLARYERRAEVHARLGIPAGAPLLLFVGRVLRAKGLREAVSAMRLLSPGLGAHLVVVGDGPDRSESEALAARLGVQDHVHFLGQIPEASALDFYCGCDILVFPTYHPEGFPMTVFQSLAAGLGVVTTRIRATADYLQDPDNACFVPARDAQAVATAVETLLRDAPRLAAMREANRNLARRFERRIVAGEIGAIYGEILQRGAPVAQTAGTRHDGEDA